MIIVCKIFLLLLSTLLVQHKAFSFSKNSGKISVNVSVSKSLKSVNESAEVKTQAFTSKSIVNNSISSKNKSISKAAETPSVKNSSNEQSYSYDNNDNLFDDTYRKNDEISNKVNGYKSNKKFEIAKKERLLDTIKKFKNEKDISEVDLKKLDNFVNKRIKEIAKKIKFKFDEEDKEKFFELTKDTNANIERIERKAELVDYVQKTFEVMGLIN